MTFVMNVTSPKRDTLNRNILTLLFCLVPPACIYLCLIVLGSAALTFLVFYLGICTLIPAADGLIHHRSHRRFMGRTFRMHLGLVYSPRALGEGILSGAVFAGAVIAFFTLLRESLIDEERLRAVLANWNIDRSAALPLFFVMILANPVFEEFYWRGFIIHRFRGTLRPPLGMILSSMGYASYHLITAGFLFGPISGLLLSLPVFFAGLFWGRMRLKNESLFGGILSHLLADAGIMAVYALYIADLLPAAG